MGGNSGWFQVGGTSLGTAVWAGLRAVGGANLTNTIFYQNAKNTTLYPTFFRDVLTGTNGSCGFFCTAATSYDYVTGLGSPLSVSY